MIVALLFATLPASLYYLGSRAIITRSIWTKYPKDFALLMDCAACSGFWWTLIVALSARGLGCQLPLQDRTPLAPLILALAGIVWVPVIAAVHQAAIERVGSAIPEDLPDADQASR